MKIRGTITSIQDCGDMLLVHGQGERDGDAAWRDLGVFEFKVSARDRDFKTLHVGRRLTITIEPQPRRRS